MAWLEILGLGFRGINVSKHKIFWGLDLGSSAIKLVRLEETGDVLSLQTFGPVPLESPSLPLPQELLISGLKNLLGSLNRPPKSVVAALPRHLAVVKFPALPKAEEPQFAQMVKLEAQRYVPFALEEVVLDFHPLGSFPDPVISKVPRAEKERIPETASSGSPLAEVSGEVPQGISSPPLPSMPVTPGVSESLVEVLLIAVQRNVVTNYWRALKSANLHCERLMVSSLGLASLYLYSEAENAPPGVDLLLDLGGRSTVVTAFKKGKMIFNRAATVGCDSLTTALQSDLNISLSEAEVWKRERGLTLLQSTTDLPHTQNWVQNFLSEVRRSVAALTSERRDAVPQRVLIAGGGAKLPALRDLLEEELGLPVLLLPTHSLPADPQFMEATGLALLALLSHKDSSTACPSINLVPPEVVIEAQRSRRLRVMQGVGTGFGVLLLAAGYIGWQSLQERAEEVARVRAAQQTVQQVQRQADTISKKVKTLEEQIELLEPTLNPSATYLDILNDMVQRMPEGLWLTGITLEKGKPLVLRGTATGNGPIAQFTSDLGKSPYLQAVTLTYANEATIGNTKVVQFGITAQIRGNKPKPQRVRRARTRPVRGASSESESTLR